jgi:hypothetical protein
VADVLGGNDQKNYGAYGNFYINIGTSDTVITGYLGNNAMSGLYKETPIYSVSFATFNSSYKAEQVSRISNQLGLISIYIYE